MKRFFNGGQIETAIFQHVDFTITNAVFLQ